MLKFIIRKALHRAGLLHKLRASRRRTDRPLFNPADPRTQLSTAACIDWLMAHGALEGTDVLEFGIFRGFNVWFSQAYCRLRNVQDVRFFGFDSFFGLPAITGIDSAGSFKEGEFSAYREDVEYYFDRYGVDWKRTTLVEGFFSETLSDASKEQLGLRRCALAVVDCDLYSSAVDVLVFLERVLAPRSIVYFDDWADFRQADAGEQRAFAEFQQRTANTFIVDEILLPGGITKGKAFALRRTDVEWQDQQIRKSPTALASHAG